MPTGSSRFPDERGLKRQAKALLRAMRTGDPDAQRRFVAQGRQANALDVQLAQALLVVAREHGFASWPKLKAHLAALRVAGQRRQERAAARLVRKAARDQLTAERTTILLTAARVGSSEQLAALFGRLPRREIEAIRAALLVRNDGAYDAVVVALIAGLRHPDSTVRYGCAGALDHFGDAQAIGPLRALLDDPVPRVRRMALHALSCEACKLAPSPDDPDLVALLARHALQDDSINVRRHAAYALASRRDDPRAAAALDQLRREENDPAIVRHLRRVATLDAGDDPPQRSRGNTA